MRLVAVTLRNYRMHAELTVRFDPSRTLIGGPNESGKSTLVEAIHRVLFYRHTSKVDLAAIRPRHHSAAPEVTLEFEVGDGRYVLRKVFRGTQSSVATLTDHAGERFDGNAAEEKLLDLLDVDAASRRELRGQWSHLWVWQGAAADDPTGPDVLQSAAKPLRRRLVDIAGGGVTETDRDATTFGHVVSAHGTIFTSTGVVRRDSELFAARQQLEAATAAAAAAAAQLAALDEAARALAREEATIRDHAATLETAETGLEQARRTLDSVEQLEAALVRQRAARDAAARDYTALADVDARIGALGREIADLRTAQAPLEAEIARLADHERRTGESASRAADGLTQAATAQQEAAASRRLVEALGQALDLAGRREILDRMRVQLEEHEARLEKTDDLLRTLPAITPADAAALDDLERRLEVAQGARAAVATRIELIKTDTDVSVAGALLAGGGERTLTEAADLLVGATTIRITPGGGQSLVEVQGRIATLEAEIGRLLAGLGVATAAAARRAHADRLAAEDLRERHRDAIRDLGGDALKDELRQVVERITAVEAEIGRMAPVDFERPATAAALASLREQMDDRHRRADQAFAQARSAFDDARAAVEAARGQVDEAEAKAADGRMAVQRLAGEQSSLERAHGTDREAELARRAASKKHAEDEVREGERALAGLGPEAVRGDVDRLERTVNVTKDQIAAARERQGDARGRLRQAGTTDLHGAKALADARLELAERRHAEIDRRARALDHLRTLFEGRRRAVAEHYAGPLRAKVTEYLDALFGAGSRVALTMTERGLEGLRVARAAIGGVEFAFDELSGGTREQVAAACRLAMAEVLAGDRPGACLPIMFDDAFVNADPERIEAVQRVLDLAARRGLQIIVLSCTPREYGLLGAARIDLEPIRLDHVDPAAGGAPRSTEAARAADEGPDGVEEDPGAPGAIAAGASG